MDVPNRKDSMTRVSTALLAVGPKTISPWSDRAYRVHTQAQLVEGGSSAYWIVTPTQPAQRVVVPDEIELPSPSPEGVVTSVVFLLAAHVGSDNTLGLLEDLHDVTLDGNPPVARIAPFWELSEMDTHVLAGQLASRVRLAVTLLDDMSIMDGEPLDMLRALGFDLDVFTLQRQGLPQ